MFHQFLLKIYLWFRRQSTHIRYCFLKKKLSWDVRNATETVDYVLKNHCSVSRFGDGEFYIMWKMVNSPFQTVNEKLSQRLEEVLNSQMPNHIVCVPHTFVCNKGYNKETSEFIETFMVNYYDQLDASLMRGRTYYDTNFTRFYYDFEDKTPCKNKIAHIRKIWDNRDLYIIEGQSTRFGVGNDLLDNARSVHRILCPPKNAFDRYDEILEAAKTIPQDALIICALGMTATVLAYDLALSGIQAIDIGHLDVEYEWFKMGTLVKCAIPGKAVNEAGYQTVQDRVSDKKYTDSIIKEIL